MGNEFLTWHRPCRSPVTFRPVITELIDTLSGGSPKKVAPIASRPARGRSNNSQNDQPECAHTQTHAEADAVPAVDVTPGQSVQRRGGRGAMRNMIAAAVNRRAGRSRLAWGCTAAGFLGTNSFGHTMRRSVSRGGFLRDTGETAGSVAARSRSTEITFINTLRPALLVPSRGAEAYGLVPLKT